MADSLETGYIPKDNHVNLVRFSDKHDVMNITPHKVFMPQISALLCRETLLEQYSPVAPANKSRDADRRHLSITSMQHDIDNLRKYLGDQMRSKGLSALYPDTTQCKTCCGPKPFRSSCCDAFLRMIAYLLCLPCLLVSYCTKNIRCHKPKINILQAKNENVTAMEDYDYFWDPIDTTDEEYHQYRDSVKPVLLDWLHTKNPQSWDKIDKELTELCINDYSNRFKVWLDLFASERICINRDKIGHGLRMMQIAYNNGSRNIILQMIEDGQLNEEVRASKFDFGLYKGTTPLHLAIINKCQTATSKLLSHHDCYELLHQRADSTPLREMFPTIELPLNLAVWVGDPNIVTLLIDTGAEMCSSDQDGNNPMHVVALLAEENPDKALQMLEVLLDLIDSWLEHTTECKALLDLSLKKGRLVALNMLFKSPNKQRMTPLKLAAKSGCAAIVQRIWNIDKLYRFPLYKLGPKSESLYDFSEIDPLLTHGEDTVSMLEILVYEENDKAIDILGLPQITALKDQKNKRLRVPIALAIVFHIVFMTLQSLSFYMYLLPKMKETTNSTVPSTRYHMHSVDIMVLIISCIYMLIFLVGSLSCVQMARRIHMSFWNISFVVASMQLPTVGGYSGSLILYFILKATENEYEIFMLSFAMLFGWIHCIYFTRMFRSTSFFAIMLHRVLVEDILRFLSIIGIMVLSYTMMTSAVLSIDSAVQEPDAEDEILSATGPIPIAFDFFKLASGITDFTLLHKSSYWFFSGAIYISFLVIANILMFNLLIASMSNRYALISGNSELLCTKVILEDVLMWEWMMPQSMQKSAQCIYEHRIVRVRLNANHYMENRVYLLQAPDPDGNTLHLQQARHRATIHYS